MKKILILMMLLFSFSISGCSRRGAVEFRSLSAVSEETAEEEMEQQEETSFSEIPDEKEREEEEATTLSLYVDISGEVERPGVYELPDGNRIFHAILAAGGFTDRAETRCVNQAEALYDGEKIYIYSREEAEQLGGWKQLSAEDGIVSGGSSSPGNGSAPDYDGKVNLNQADKNQLMTLAGVGEAKAEAIISYREMNGAFDAIEDIMKVSGIKEKLFEQICDKITV